jgi:hypothetical protein
MMPVTTSQVNPSDAIGEATEFFDRVLPDAGDLVIVYRVMGKEAMIHEAFTAGPERNSKAATRALALSKKADVWTACATFKTGSIVNSTGRTAKNAHALQAMRLDIDVGPDKPLATKSQAATAVAEFCERFGLPLPIIIDSGGGLHVWWPLDAPVDSGRWKTSADAFKHACGVLGFAADPTVTADLARMLRVPGTLNFKYDPSKPVRLKNADGIESVKRMSLDDFDQKVAAAVGGPASSVQPLTPSGPDVPAYIVELVHDNPDALASSKALAVSVPGVGATIDDIEAAAPFVTYASVLTLHAARGWPKPDSVRDAWRDRVLLPLKQFALAHPEHEARAHAVFDEVACNFSSNFDKAGDEEQWSKTRSRTKDTAPTRTIASYIEAAVAGGFDLRGARGARSTATESPNVETGTQAGAELHETIELASGHVTYSAAVSYGARLGRSCALDMMSAWREVVLEPLRGHAAAHAVHATDAQSIYLGVSQAFSVPLPDQEIARLWNDPTVRLADPQVFVACARAGGFDDTIATKLRAAREGNQTIELLNLEFKHGLMGSSPIIVYSRGGFGPNAKPSFIKVAEFRNLKTTRVLYRDKWGRDTRETEAAAWLASDRRETFGSVVFEPGGAPNPRDFNTWRPSPFLPREGDVLPFFAYTERLIPDPVERTYFLSWFAFRLQFLRRLPRVAMILAGDEGIGKTSIIHLLGELFTPHYRGTLKASMLAEVFNSEVEACLLGLFDDAVLPKAATAIAAANVLVSEATIRIRRMHTDAYEQRNFGGFVFTTNEAHLGYFSRDARRWMPITCSNYFKGRFAELEAFRAYWASGGREAVLDYLLGIDLTGFQVDQRPETAAVRRQRELSLNPIESVIQRVLCGGHLEYLIGAGRGEMSFPVWANGAANEGWIPTMKLAEATGSRTNEIHGRALADTMARLLNARSTRRRPAGRTGQLTSGYTIPPLDDARRLFSERTRTGGFDDCADSSDLDPPYT